MEEKFRLKEEKKRGKGGKLDNKLKKEIRKNSKEKRREKSC